MQDLPQSLILIVIIILAVIFVVLGVQSFFILREFRKTLKKTNSVLDEVKGGTNVAKFAGVAASVLLSGNLGKILLGLLSPKGKEEKKDKVLKVENIEIPEVKKSPVKTVRRFFRRNKSL